MIFSSYDEMFIKSNENEKSDAYVVVKKKSWLVIEEEEMKKQKKSEWISKAIYLVLASLYTHIDWDVQTR